MAQKAKKDQARANTAALNNLHLGFAVVNGLFIAFYLFFKSRSIFLYILLSLPSFLCGLTLERAGRPSYDPNTKALKSSGEDLSAPGLTEYMWDVIWVTWATQILVILFGNKLWFLWAVVPAYGAYKGFGLLGMARQMAGMQGIQGADQGAPPPAGNRKQRRAA